MRFCNHQVICTALPCIVFHWFWNPIRVCLFLEKITHFARLLISYERADEKSDLDELEISFLSRVTSSIANETHSFFFNFWIRSIILFRLSFDSLEYRHSKKLCFWTKFGSMRGSTHSLSFGAWHFFRLFKCAHRLFLFFSFVEGNPTKRTNR